MKWIAIAAGAVLVLYSTYKYTYPVYSYRWRVTIQIETEEGIRTGSSVLETSTVAVPIWAGFGNVSYRTRARGEATFVDLGHGRNLVALLATGPNAEDGRVSLFVPRAFFPVVEGNPHDVQWSRTLASMNGRRPYGPPTLVTFRDLRDPASVQNVPYGAHRDVRGPDILSMNAWVELTEDNVSTGLEEYLPWIHDFSSTRRSWEIIKDGRYASSAPSQIFSMNTTCKEQDFPGVCSWMKRLGMPQSWYVSGP